MTDALIGHSGFVGGSLRNQRAFDAFYRSVDIHTLPDRGFDTLYCAGAPGKKWLANREPEADAAAIARLTHALERARAKRIVLISTVDVFGLPVDVDEGDEPVPTSPYGQHRRALEQFVQQHFEQALVVRLPGLVGPGLRKNALFDLAHGRPVDTFSPGDTFQFYPMVNLSKDIDRALAADLSCIHLTAAPTPLGPLAEQAFSRTLAATPHRADVRYDVQTQFASLWRAGGRYQYDEGDVHAAVRAYARDTQAA